MIFHTFLCASSYWQSMCSFSMKRKVSNVNNELPIHEFNIGTFLKVQLKPSLWRKERSIHNTYDLLSMSLLRASQSTVALGKTN
jgi:hypothetical protein